MRLDNPSGLVSQLYRALQHLKLAAGPDRVHFNMVWPAGDYVRLTLRVPFRGRTPGHNEAW